MKVLPLILSCLLSSCATMEKAGHDLMQTDRTEKLTSSFFEVVKPKLQATYPKVGSKYLDDDMTLALNNNVYFLDTKHLNNYANNIMRRLLNKSKISADIQVEIIGTVNFDAIAYKHGLITISPRTFQDLNSEDELAALLAHEASHILLEHNKYSLSSTFYTNIEKAIDMSILYNSKGGDVEQYLKLQGIKWILTSVIASAWDRAQENEADALGVDLLANAGYRIEAMLGNLKVIRNIEKASLQTVNQHALSLSHKNSFTSQVNVGKIIENVIIHLKKDLEKNHDDTKKRMKLVKTYIKKYHANERKRKPTRYSLLKAKRHIPHYLTCATNLERSLSTKNKYSVKYARCALSGKGKNDLYARKVMADYRKSVNQPKRAIKNLTHIVLGKRATAEAYRDLALLTFKQGSYKKSQKIVAEYERKFENHDLIPVHMAASKRLGKDIRLEEIKCSLFNFAQKDICSQAASGLL